MPHEQSETFQDQSGRWQNYYGRGPGMGLRIPLEQGTSYGSSGQAVEAAKARSMMHPHYEPPTPGPQSKGADSLAAHTPSKEYVAASVKRRALELLGAQGGLVNTLAPLPYQSKYPLAPKLLDALITLSIDPVIKPASLKGELDRMPALKKLATTLADKGYFRSYPKGGIGIGGGSEGGEGAGGATGGGTAGGGTAADEGYAPEGDPGVVGATGPPGYGGFGGKAGEADPDPEGTGTRSAPTAADTAAAARLSSPTFSNLVDGLMSTFGLGPTRGNTEAITSLTTTAISALMSLFGGPPIGGAMGLVGNTAIGMARSQASDLAAALNISQNDAMAALAGMSQNVAATDAATGISGTQGGGGQGVFFANEMTAPGPVIGTGPVGSTGAAPISPATRANAAARVGGGISPQFLAALESIQKAA